MVGGLALRLVGSVVLDFRARLGLRTLVEVCTSRLECCCFLWSCHGFLLGDSDI